MVRRFPVQEEQPEQEVVEVEQEEVEQEQVEQEPEAEDFDVPELSSEPELSPALPEFEMEREPSPWTYERSEARKSNPQDDAWESDWESMYEGEWEEEEKKIRRACAELALLRVQLPRVARCRIMEQIG